MNERFEKYLAKDNSKTLHILIADECHWGIGKGGDNDRFVNDEELCNRKNVVHLLVSGTISKINFLSIAATPQNVLTQNSRIPDDVNHVVDWFQDSNLDYGL